MSTTPHHEKSDKTVPFTTAEDAAKIANGAAPSSTAAVDMVNRVADKAHATIDRLATTAAPAAQQLQKSLEDTNEMLHERADRLRATGNEWCDGVRANVREHPLMAIGTALAVGMLIARLTR
ncbi:MAG: hypothetical protein J7598_14490 [Mitsuaria chitosanitabida]|uniref:hypothetical protein n=1 Tax=Roseateles chitosanitabidus TaxID=65048 RepID=UPI001B081A29|nr:hypothetical protein [Roseateles chitosanitabidus]MBO9687810.1 hypothetical protein [Roseateles chitosanitabidus]